MDLEAGGFISHTVAVGASTMHYWESGHGQPLVFLHGNPTSSYLWRKVLAHLTASGRRLIAVDLIGMGGSGKPEIGYRLADHIEYAELLLDALALQDIVFVAHDWGCAIGLDYLRRHPSRVCGVAFMEGHLRPLPSWADFDPDGRQLFQQLRTADVGEHMVLHENFFIETLLPAAMPPSVTEDDLKVYGRPFPDAASRRPLLQWAREIPVAGEPADVADILDAGWKHLATSPVRKLLVYGQPGAVVGPETLVWCRRTQPSLAVADVGAAGHFLPEDQPVKVAGALKTWLSSLQDGTTSPS